MSQTLAKVINDKKKTIMPSVREYYGHLIGGTITDVFLVKDERYEWTHDEYTPILTVQKDDGSAYLVELWSDTEGNGSGHAEIVKHREGNK